MRPVILLLALSTSLGIAADESRTLKGEAPAADLKSLRLDARVGQVEVVAHDADSVVWELTLEPQREGIFSSRRKALEQIAKAEVEARSSGSRFLLEVRLPAGTDKEDIKEEWKVRVPARFSADVDMAVGQMAVRGVSGGVDADLAVGEIDIEVPGGRIHAEVNVGEVSIETGTDSPGDIELGANVGDVSLQLDGYRVPAERGFGPGAEIDMRRDGRDDIEASVNVGDVRVVVK